MSTKIETPELDKEAEARANGSQEIGAFLDWLLHEQGGITLCRWQVQTEEISCTGLARDGRPNGLFDGDNCDAGEIARHRVRIVYDDHIETHLVGDECPRCEGRGVREVRGEEGFVPDRRGIKELLADYFEIDLDKAERERMALLESLRAAQ